MISFDSITTRVGFLLAWLLPYSCKDGFCSSRCHMPVSIFHTYDEVTLILPNHVNHDSFINSFINALPN
jgi:hypothetical protein